MHNWQAEEFWHWSGKCYANPDIKRTCLHLQDEFACNVNVLLLCLYVGKAKRMLDASCIKALTRAIDSSEAELSQHRKIRRAAKAGDVARYETLLSEELELEKLQQSQLIQQLNKLTLVESTKPVLKTNIVNYLHMRGLHNQVNEEEYLYLLQV